MCPNCWSVTKRNDVKHAEVPNKDRNNNNMVHTQDLYSKSQTESGKGRHEKERGRRRKERAADAVFMGTKDQDRDSCWSLFIDITEKDRYKSNSYHMATLSLKRPGGRWKGGWKAERCERACSIAAGSASSAVPLKACCSLDRCLLSELSWFDITPRSFIPSLLHTRALSLSQTLALSPFFFWPSHSHSPPPAVSAFLLFVSLPVYFIFML